MVSLSDFIANQRRGVLASASPQLARFTQTQKPTIDIAGLSRARELELAGAGDAEIERARQFDRARGEAGVIPARSLLEGTTSPTGDFVGGEDTQPKGLLESFGNVLQRGVSASVGGITGLFGAERLRETAGTGEMFDRGVGAQAGESNISLALRRFAEGLSGDEMYRFADFGVLAYDRETTGLGERAMKATAGFVLDTLVDPLTYMSLGGSIFGRARGATRVFEWSNTRARKAVEGAVSQLPVERRLDIIARASETHAMSPAMIRQRISQNLEEAYPVGTVGRRKAQEQIARLETDFMDPQFLNELLLKAPTFATQLASDVVAANSAVAYRIGSSSGLRNYMRKEFGENGMTLYRAMPADIQGGVRMRLPFSAMGGRDPKVLFRIPGTERIAGLTNGTRQYLRNSMPGVRNLSQKANGRWGDLDMQLASAAYASKRNAATKVFGAADPDTRAIFWFDNEATKQVTRADIGFNKIVRDIVNDWQVGREHVKTGTQLWARQLGVPEDKASEAFNNAMDQVLTNKIRNSDGTLRPQSITEAFGESPTPAELEAYGAAMSFNSVTDRIAGELEQLFPADGPGKVFNRLQSEGEYWPRMIDYMNDAIGPRQPGGAATSKVFSRENFFSVYDYDGTALQSMSPSQIARRFGANNEGALFITDPVDAMLAYMVASAKIISEERMFQNMLNSGLIVRGQPRLVPNIDAAREAVIEAANELAGRQARLAGLSETAIRRDPQKVLDALNGWKTYERTIFDNYRRSAPREGEQFTSVFSSADGTRVVSRSRVIDGVDEADGDWLAQNAAGKYLTRDNKFTTDIKRAARFRTRDDAQTVLGANPRIIENRTKLYQDEAQKLMTQFKRDTAEAFTTFEALDPTGLGNPVFIREAATGRWHPNPAHPSNIPLGEDANRYIAQLTEWVNEYAYETTPERFRSMALIGERYRVGAEGQRMFRELSEKTNSTNVQSYIQQRFEKEGLFAPATLVEPIRRMYQVREKPEGFMKFVDSYYRPFYSVQKALMTAQRGPGYVARNVQGGMWNAWLFGVRAGDFATSAKVNIAKIRAVAEGKRLAQERVAREGLSDIVTEYETTELTMQAFQRILGEQFGDRRGKELFRAWETFANQGLDGRRVASRTMGTQAVTRIGEPDVQLRRLTEQNMDWYENATDYLAARSRWAELTGGLAAESEDYLRFATYLRGVKDFGLEDGGIAASLYVKASQFDYSDLSDFETDVLKMIVPFYTWARNNIPLQARAIISEPGKVNAALRINDAFRDMFGEEDDPEEPMPAYVRERMGWRVRADLIEGPFGDALAAGVVVGEPLVDVNRLFRFPSGDRRGGINLRDVANQMNPIFKNAAELLSAMETSTGGVMPRREESPGWLAAIQRPFLDEGEEPTARARTLRLVRNSIPPIGMAERLFPQALGNERMQRRWYTSIASSLFGLPVSTLDPFQTAAELRAEEQRQRRILESKFGEDYTEYTAFARSLLERQVTPQEMNWLKQRMFDGRELTDVQIEELDHYKARDLVDLKRRLDHLQSIGVDEQRLDQIVRNFRPRSDFTMAVRQGRPQAMTPEILETFGLTQRDVENMTSSQRQRLINDFFN